MIVKVFGCRRFRQLLNDREDRPLHGQEEAFLARHREACADCRTCESSHQLSLNMLRSASLDPEPAAHFDERVIRRLRLQQVRESLGYWRPAFVGAMLACVALFATLHVLSLDAPRSSIHLPSGEALRERSAFPELQLDRLPSFDR
jgi:hypothetical protein